MLVGADCFHPNRAEIVNSSSERNNSCNVRRASLKFVRQLVVSRPLETHRTNHVAPSLVRRHLIEKAGFTIKYSDAGRTVSLVSRKSVKIAIQLADIDAAMGYCLSPIKEHRDTLAVS